jgi:hypothetical protein
MSARHIDSRLIQFLDDALISNGLARHATETQDARTLFVLAAEALVGIKEETGRNDGQIIQWIQSTIGTANGEPYCMAGIQSCGAYAEMKTNVPFKLFPSESVRLVWDKTPEFQRVKRLPLPGAVACWGNLVNGKFNGKGHAEIVRACDGEIFQGIGFNTIGTTKPGETVNREGNGIYFTIRSMESTAERKLLGFLKPF